LSTVIPEWHKTHNYIKLMLAIESMVGNTPNYSQYDVIRCFLLLKKEPRSRKHITEKLAVGEGSVRSILDTLKERQLIASHQTGHRLTREGAALMDAIHQHLVAISPVRLGEINSYPKTGVLLRGIERGVNAVELRDWSIRHGGLGALILRYDGGLAFASSQKSDLAAYAASHDELNHVFEFRNHDMLVVCFAQSEKDATDAALAVAARASDILQSLFRKIVG
jgi:hypothetical protein